MVNDSKIINMKKINNKLRLIVFLSIIIVILLVVYVIIDHKNRQTTIQKNSVDKIDLNKSEEVVLNYNYVGEFPNLEKTALAYEIIKREIDVDEIKNLINNFGFQEKDIFQGKYSYYASDMDKSVNYDAKSNFFQYLSYEEPIKTILEENELISRSKEFLEKNNLIDEKFKLSDPEIKYVSSDGYNLIMVDHLVEAKYLQIRYNLLLNESPVISSERKNEPIEVLVNLDGTIKKASAMILFGSEFKKLGQAQLTQIHDALDAINDGMGVISEVIDPNSSYSSLTEEDFIKSIPGLGQIDIGKNVLFNNIEIIYVWDNNTNSIQPFYRFSGMLNHAYSEDISIKVLIQALPEYLYKQD